MELTNDTFQRKVVLEPAKSVLNTYAMLTLLCDSK